jgi:membrane-bound metal-dependent hydrolase YbcI (DUF457 family)
MKRNNIASITASLIGRAVILVITYLKTFKTIPRKFPHEPHMFPIIVTSLDSTDNKHGIQRQVRRCSGRRNFIYYIEYFRKAAGILLLMISEMVNTDYACI